MASSDLTSALRCLEVVWSGAPSGWVGGDWCAMGEVRSADAAGVLRPRCVGGEPTERASESAFISQPGFGRGMKGATTPARDGKARHRGRQLGLFE
jgi:hypothetical protein